jgi:hypothetical protein
MSFLMFSVKEDLQNEVANPLVEMRGDASTPLLHLALFGRATPYLHNGSMEVKDENGQVVQSFYYYRVGP